MTASTPSPDRVRGFSLIELAVVVFIVGLLLGSIFLPIQSRVEIRNYEQTQRVLDQAREALIGYAAANGRFPCPASNANAAESFAAGGTTGNGNCNNNVGWIGPAVYVGFLPAVTLGFTPVDASGYAVDAWGRTQNRIRYAVSRVTISTTNPFTRTGGMRTATMNSIANTALIYVCGSGTGVNPAVDCGTATTLTSNAPVVIWSVGPNAATGGTIGDELQNPNPNGGSVDRIFVSRTKTAVGEGGGEFDDIVTWIGGPALFNRLIAAGQLP